MDEYTLYIAAANTATMLAASAVALLAYRAYRRTGSSALQAVSVGFGFVVAGCVLGALAHLLQGNLPLGVTIQSAFTAGGFVILLYSLYVGTATARVTMRWSE